MESVEGEKVLMSAKEDEVVEKIAVENVVEVEKDLKVQEGVGCWNCDGHQCELESDKIEVEDEERRKTESEESESESIEEEETETAAT